MFRFGLHTVLRVTVVIFMISFLLSLGVAWAQTPTEQPKWVQFATAAADALVPALWTFGGSAVMLAITSFLNKYAVFVPRSVQVVLAAVFTGLGAFFGAGMDLSHVVGAAVNSGAVSTVAATHPDTLKLSPS